MSTKTVLLALAAAFAAASASLDKSAAAIKGEGGESVAAPPPKAAVTSGKKGGKVKPAEISFDDCKEQLMAIMSGDGGKEWAVATLSRFGVGKLGELSEEQYAEFHAYAKSVAEGEQDPTQTEGGGDDDLLG